MWDLPTCGSLRRSLVPEALIERVLPHMIPFWRLYTYGPLAEVVSISFMLRGNRAYAIGSPISDILIHIDGKRRGLRSWAEVEAYNNKVYAHRLAHHADGASATASAAASDVETASAASAAAASADAATTGQAGLSKKRKRVPTDPYGTWVSHKIAAREVDRWERSRFASRFA